jgi:methyl coenzyme M reductase subunit D
VATFLSAKTIEKPLNKLEMVKTIVEIFAGLTAIAKAIFEMFKG